MNQESGQKIGFDVQSLDLLLDSFAESVADPNCERSKLYASINQNIVACTESQASAILVKNQEEQIRVVHQFGWNDLKPGVSKELDKHVRQILNGQQRAGLKNHSLRTYIGACTPQNGLTFLYILVRTKPDAELAGQVFCDLANEIATQISAFESRLAAEQDPKSIVGIGQLAQAGQNLGKSFGLDEMSFHLVNDLAKITKADRVTYVANTGKIKAVSGVSQVSLQTSVARNLSKIARNAVTWHQTIEWADGDIATDGNRTIRGLPQLIQDLNSAAGFAIPSNPSGRACGVLLFEYFSNESELNFERHELVNEAVNFVSPILARGVQVNSIPAIKSLNFLFNRFLKKPVRVLIASVVLLMASIGLLSLLFGVERPLEIYGEGKLQTSRVQHVFSHIEGGIDQLLVQEGTNLEKDQRLLVISSKDLNNELVTIEGEMEESKQELSNLLLADFDDSSNDTAAVDQTKNANDIERLKIRLNTLDARLAFYEGKKSDLVINSPISGQVTTTHLRQRLTGRPIKRGDLLMTVSDTEGQWEIELEVPDNRIGFVKHAQAESGDQPLEVVFRLASDSKKNYRGTLKRLDYRSDERADTEKSVVLAYVDINESELGDALRLGTRVHGKICCGDRNNFFLLTYETRNKIREWLFR